MTTLSFALNHMTAPALSPDAFFTLAKSLGISAVEIRNDLDGNAIIDGTPAAEIKALADSHGLTIISINALQRFNDWNDARARKAQELIAYARDCGAKALVLVPVNDGSGQAAGERQANLRQALAALKPMLNAAGITGLVEPLGFAICSLRSKTEAVEGIRAVSGENIFKIVHDTFHHYLAAEEKFHPDMTGLIHISGVADPDVTVSAMRDPHRILVNSDDRLDNAGQIRKLRDGGYAGPLSFEPFSPAVHQSTDIKTAIHESMTFLASKA